MNKITITAVTAALALGSAVSFAQEVKPIGLSARLGLAFPTSSAARDAGKTWFGGGVDYKLGDMNLGGANTGYVGSYGISVDYFQKGDFRTVPVTLNYVGRSQNFYYLAGAGVSFNRTAASSSDTEFAYVLGLGVEFSRFNQPLFAELRWLGNGESDLSAWGVYVGIRF